MSRKTPVGRKSFAVLGVQFLFVLALGSLLLTAWGTGGERIGNASDTADQAVEYTSDTEPPNVAEAAAVEIDESSIPTNLAQLTGASPAPLSSGPTTISDLGGEDGRRAAAEYMQESFEKIGIPARILEFPSGDRRGFNVEGILQVAEGTKHLRVTAHLDSFYNAGAEDDASGLVSVLSTAKRSSNSTRSVPFIS